MIDVLAIIGQCALMIVCVAIDQDCVNYDDVKCYGWMRLMTMYDDVLTMMTSTMMMMVNGLVFFMMVVRLTGLMLAGTDG